MPVTGPAEYPENYLTIRRRKRVVMVGTAIIIWLLIALSGVAYADTGDAVWLFLASAWMAVFSFGVGFVMGRGDW